MEKMYHFDFCNRDCAIILMSLHKLADDMKAKILETNGNDPRIVIAYSDAIQVITEITDAVERK